MFVAVQKVRKGDTIRDTYLDGNRELRVENGPGTKVTKIEHGACSGLGAHVNSRYCYDGTALVWRESSARTDVDDILAASDYKIPETVDWDIDNNVPASDTIKIDPAERLLVDIFADPERLDGALHTLVGTVASGAFDLREWVDKTPSV